MSTPLNEYNPVIFKEIVADDPTIEDHGSSDDEDDGANPCPDQVLIVSYDPVSEQYVPLETPIGYTADMSSTMIIIHEDQNQDSP